MHQRFTSDTLPDTIVQEVGIQHDAAQSAAKTRHPCQHRACKIGDSRTKLLNVVDAALTEAIQDHQIVWLRLRLGTPLSYAVQCASFASSTIETCLAHVPDDPRALYDLANILFQQGELISRKRHAVKSDNALVAHLDGKEARGLLRVSYEYG